MSDGGLPPQELPPLTPTTPDPVLSEPPLVSPEVPMALVNEAVANGSAATPPVLSPSPEKAAVHPIVFHGRTDEFFRIWIVNTLLTILTCGIFFAWAKVRKRRYLRASTEFLGHRFDYRADPVRLLVGHLVVLTLFLGYALFGAVYPAIRYGVIAVGIVLLPWIVVRSLSFNAHNTVYRGLHFRFNASLSAALKVYLLEPVLIGLTLGFYYPAWERSKREYIVSNHRLGDAYFHFEATAGRFYSTYFLAGTILMGALTAGGALIGWMTVRYGPRQTVAQLLPFFIIYAFGFFISRQLIFARLFNHIWNHTRIDEHRFQAQLRVGHWLRLQLANLFAIIFTAGLLYPWALMRTQRMVAAALEFAPAGSVDTVQRIGGADGSATGDMAAEFIGLDFGL